MAHSLYLINPAVDFPTYFGGEVFAGGGRPAAEIVADLTLPTVAALLPPEVRVEFCNENVTAVDFDRPVDAVGITGKVSQQRRMFAIADEFRRRGKTVLIGGPFASLSPEVVRPHCDTLVQGELEGVAAELFSDLQHGTLRPEYAGERPDLSATPVPRWDLYSNSRTLMGAVQTSRGCPFECEFCDVIPYVGRKQRTKPVDRILAELDALYAIGYREVFFADDNFSASRRFAKELLAALAAWNGRREQGRVGFMTELSIDTARDPELLDLIAAAGMRKVYMGIETPNLEGLKETHKRQNLVGDLVELVHRFYERGVAVFAGMIVGFDADRRDIFEWQFDFAMASSIPVFTLGTLVAPDRTPLAARMQREGRLLEQSSTVTAAPWTTNIRPKHMSADEQHQGMRWLANSLYHPDCFGERLLALLDKLGPLPGAGTVDKSWGGRHIDGLRTDVQIVLMRLARRGEAEARLLGRVRKALERRPEAASLLMPMVLTYAQVRHMYDCGRFWDPHVQSPSGSAVAAPRAGGGLQPAHG